MRAAILSSYANVVDDHHMRITHVLRGVEWQVGNQELRFVWTQI